MSQQAWCEKTAKPRNVAGASATGMRLYESHRADVRLKESGIGYAVLEMTELNTVASDLWTPGKQGLRLGNGNHN